MGYFFGAKDDGHSAGGLSWTVPDPSTATSGGILLGSHGSPWTASSLHEARLLTSGQPIDQVAEAGADRMVETCAMWVFMGSMVCAIVSLGFLVLPMVIDGY